MVEKQILYLHCASAGALSILDGHQVEPLPNEVRDGMTRSLAGVEVMA